ncbi:MAG: zinc ribbon domain-containing protein [Eggerthellaceae bacterium]|nr:zinc ribbon domain-containing protein [Eggerthellaceae bacterium]
MNEILSQLWTPQLQTAVTVIVGILVVLYVLSIIWVVRDAYLRGSWWFIWAIVALIPLIGVIAYCLLRPPLLQIDRDEQELEIAIKQRELMKYGECANCGYPVEIDYVLCPNCHTQLKNLCTGCGRALDPTWTVCPFCTTPLGGAPAAAAVPRRNAPVRSHANPAVAASPQKPAPQNTRAGRQRHAQPSLEEESE